METEVDVVAVEHQEEVVEDEAAVLEVSRVEKQSSLNHIVTTEYLLLAERKTHLSHSTSFLDQRFTAKREYLSR